MILLAGASGTIGRRLAMELKIRRARLRALTRDPARARDLIGPAEFAAGDLAVPETLPAAFRGVEAAFLASALHPDLPERETAFLRAAAAAGVKRVVLVSVLGAAADAPFSAGRWHFEAEEELRRLGLPHAVLRPAPLHQGLLDSAATIRGGAYAAALGETAVPWVDARDAAAAAAAALCGELEDGIYELAGPAPLTGAEVAAVFSRVLERPVSYAPVSEEASRRALIAAGLPEWLVAARLEQGAFLRSGRAAAGPGGVRRACGREPLTLESFVRERASAFR